MSQSVRLSGLNLAVFSLSRVLGQLPVQPEKPGDHVIDKGLILVRAKRERRIITGRTCWADVCGRMFERINSAQA